MLDGLADGLVVVGADLRLHTINSEAEEILGRMVEGAEDVVSAWPGLSGRPVVALMRDAMEAGSALSTEEYLAGSSKWIEVRGRYSGGMLHVHLRDITQRKAAELALERYATDLLSAKAAFERQALEMAALREQAEMACVAAEAAREQAEASREQAEASREQAEVLREQAEASRRQAEGASAAKSAFLANMSHEIRTPMTAIVGFADLMLEPGQDADERSDCLQTIRRNARHLLDLINDILDISKIEAGKMTVEVIEVELARLVAEVVSMIRPRCLEKGLDFQLSFEGAVPRFVRTDPLRLRQILVNLLGNAVKFTRSGMVMLRVRATAAQDGARWVLAFEVVDTGIGIDPGSVGKLFQPFVQEDNSTTRRFGGTGLGLTISRRLATLLGGDISVQSTAGTGSVFTATIDGGETAGAALVSGLGEAMIPEAATATHSGAGGAAVVGSLPAGCRVLLAEDGKDNQRLISSYLTKRGARVEVADNGRIAVERVMRAREQGEAFDAILMDMQMPELDGYGATSELRRLGVSTPILALTAHAMADDRARCLAAGCSDYLSKPIDRELLIRTLAQAVLGEARPAVSGCVDAAERTTMAEATTRDSVRSEYAEDPDFADLIGPYIEALPGTVSELEGMLASGDREGLRKRLHQIKGSGGGYGFPEVTRLAGEAEQAVIAGDAGRMGVAVGALGQYCRRIEGYRSEGVAAGEVRKSA